MGAVVFSFSIVWQDFIPGEISAIVICLHVTVQKRLYTLMRKAVIYEFVCGKSDTNLCVQSIQPDDNSSTCEFLRRDWESFIDGTAVIMILNFMF